MELIPILSTIILVATISTFILAIGAYILYKVRENKSSEVHFKEEKTEAEVVEPVEHNTTVKDETINREKNHSESKFKVVQTSSDEFNPVINIYQDKVNGGNGKTKKFVEIPENKFLKYTPEGFEKLEQEGDPEEIRWR